VKRTEHQQSSQELSLQERSPQEPSALTQPRSLQEMPRPERLPQERLSQERSLQEKSVQRQSPPKPAPGNTNDIEELVRRRAYEIYEQRGSAGGSEIDDWLQAEADILNDEGLNKAA
jgi:hypothetical protein